MWQVRTLLVCFLSTLCLLLPQNWQASGGANVFHQAMTRALRRTLFEQEVEDENAIHRADNHLVRRLIVMPLTDAFNPHQANGMHGKVQYGDKCSLPASIGREIFEKPYEVPWLFEIKPLRRTSYGQSGDDDGEGASKSGNNNKKGKGKRLGVGSKHADEEDCGDAEALLKIQAQADAEAHALFG